MDILDLAGLRRKARAIKVVDLARSFVAAIEPSDADDQASVKPLAQACGDRHRGLRPHAVVFDEWPWTEGANLGATAPATPEVVEGGTGA
jgi:hypothetical protein